MRSFGWALNQLHSYPCKMRKSGCRDRHAWRDLRRPPSSSQGARPGTDPTRTALGRNQPLWHLGFRILASGTAAVQFCGLSYPGCSSFYGSPSKLREVWMVRSRWCSENSMMREQRALFTAQCMKEAVEHSSWGQMWGAGEGKAHWENCGRRKGRNARIRSSSFSLNSVSEFAFSKLPISMSASWHQ